MHRVHAFIRLARFGFPLSGLLLYLLGVALALHSGGVIEITRIGLCGLSVFCAQLAVSFSNDYFDYHIDHFTAPTVIAGGSGMLRSHPELRPIAKYTAIILTSLSLLLAALLQLLFHTPWGFLGLIIVGNLLGWSYSAPPIRLVDRGFGELAVTGIMGVLLPGSGSLAVMAHISGLVFWFIAPTVLASVVFILSVEIPDMEADRIGQKRTAITRWGRRWAFRINAVCLCSVTGYFLWLMTRPLSARFQISVIAGLSLIPLGVMLWGLRQVGHDRAAATRLATQVVGALIAFLALVDLYLVSTL